LSFQHFCLPSGSTAHFGARRRISGINSFE
jgi:hypothetical protein